MRRRTAVVLMALLFAAMVFAVFAPVVSLEADVPATGGFFTTTTTQGNTTRALTEVATPASGEGLGSVTFCYLGRGALLIQGMYYPLASPTLLIVGASCPATAAP